MATTCDERKLSKKTKKCYVQVFFFFLLFALCACAGSTGVSNYRPTGRAPVEGGKEQRRRDARADERGLRGARASKPTGVFDQRVRAPEDRRKRA